MNLIRYNLPQLARGYLNLREIALVVDIIDMISDKYVNIIRELYIMETINAQLILIDFNVMEISIPKTDLFHNSLPLMHKNYCRNSRLIMYLYAYMGDIKLQVPSCDCIDENNPTISIVEARQILRVIYDNRLYIKLIKDEKHGYQIFGYSY